jgi:hypothetical protein
VKRRFQKTVVLKAAHHNTRVYSNLLCKLPNYMIVEESRARGHILIFNGRNQHVCSKSIGFFFSRLIVFSSVQMFEEYFFFSVVEDMTGFMEKRKPKLVIGFV